MNLWESIYGSYMVDQDPYEKIRDSRISLLEAHDLLTGEVRYHEDEKRNCFLVSILGILSTMVSIVLGFFAYKLYNKTGNGFFLLLILLSVGGFVLGILICQFGMHLGPLLGGGVPSNTNKMMITYILTCAFFIGYIALSFYVAILRYFDYCNLANFHGNSEEWNKVHGHIGVSEAFESIGWAYKWVVFLLALLAAFYGVSVYAMWTAVFNRYKYSGFLYLVSALFIIIFGFLGIIWVGRARQWLDYPEVARVYGKGSLISMLNICCIIAIFFAVFAIFLRISGTKLKHFMFGLVIIVLLLVTCTITGLILKKVYIEVQSNAGSRRDPSLCKAQLDLVEQELIRPWCGEKYSLTGEKCSKGFLAYEWEEESNPRRVASLNPPCCYVTSCYFFWPFFVLGISGFFVSISLTILVGINFYYSEYYGFHHVLRKIDFCDLLLIVLSILAGVLMLIFVFWGKNVDVENDNLEGYRGFNEPGYQDQRFMGLENSDKGENIQGDYKWDYASNLKPSVVKGGKCLAKHNCYIRLAILSKNSEIFEEKEIQVRTGSPFSRLNFFPGCKNKRNWFRFYYGGEEEINNILRHLSYTLVNKDSADPEIYYYVDQVRKVDTNSEGLIPSEKKEPTKLSEKDEQNCLSGFDLYSISKGNGCVEGSCRYGYNSLDGKELIKVKGRLFYVENKEEEYSKIHDGVTVRAFSQDGQVIDTSNVQNGGYFEFKKILKNSIKNQKILIRVTDDEDIFLDCDIDRVVPMTAEDEYSIGKIRLFTRSGIFCQKDDENCKIKARIYKIGLLKVKVLDLMTNKILENEKIFLYRNFTLTKKSKDQNMRHSTFENLPYGGYLAKLESEKYNQIGSKEVVISNLITDKVIYAVPKDLNFSLILVKEGEENSKNLDLRVLVKNAEGEGCEVSAINYYCGYSKFLSYNNKGRENIQAIIIKNMSVSQYKTVVVPSPSYSYTSNCQKYNFLGKSKNSWNWNEYSKKGKLDDFQFKLTTMTPGTDGSIVTQRQDFIQKVEGSALSSNDDNDNPEYMLVNCFTGFGSKSIVYKNDFITQKSDLESFNECDRVIDKRFSLSELNRVN